MLTQNAYFSSNFYPSTEAVVTGKIQFGGSGFLLFFHFLGFLLFLDNCSKKDCLVLFGSFLPLILFFLRKKEEM